QFKIELLNSSAVAVDIAGYKIVSSSGSVATLAAQSIPAGGLAVITAAQLGFIPADGDKLFLFQSNGTDFEDSRGVTNRLRGRAPGTNGRWLYPNAGTFGASNTFAFNSAVIINEIMYKPHATSPAREKWIELYNRSTSDVDMSGWQMADGISFLFPSGTTIRAGGYLVITDDTTAFIAHHPGVAVVGPFGGSLSGQGEHLELDDAIGNPVDEVRFYNGGRWPEGAHGEGSSLERRDVRAESDVPETWAASEESARGAWQTFTWQGVASVLNGDPTQWNEFIFGLLDTGTFLIDDISVKNLSSGNVELIQNGGFESGGTTGWRFLGTHQRATVINDPSGQGKVLKVVATGGTEHMHNHAETTLKNGASFVAINSAQTYQISYRARWVSGSNQLNSRLYFNRLARTNLLPIAAGGGTPGAANSTTVSNIGPTYHNLTHSPAVPAAGQAAVVSVTANDPDGVASLSLFYKVGAGAFTSLPMTLLDGTYRATIPGQAASAKVQFYIQAADTLNATSFFPSGGSASRAIIPWNDGQARLTLNGSSPNNVRIVMTDADAAAMHVVTTVMSNDHIGCTIIYNENEIFYDCGVRLKGSERGRAQDSRVSFNIDFPADHKFLGTHSGIALDRSGAGNETSQKEILIKHAIAHAGNIPGSEDDLCRIIAPLAKHTGPGIMVKQRFDSTYLDNQYSNGSDGALFKFEYIYYPTVNSVSGNVESLKVPEPDNVVTNVNARGLGTDKELYRWHWLNLSNQEADNYSGLLTWLPTFGRSGSADAQYFIDTAKYIDTDEWLRSFAIESLFGIGDNYGGDGSGHNVIFYQRPSDMRWIFFPHDMDFTFALDPGAPLVNNPDLTKLVSKGSNLRAFYGHLLDICTTTFNRAYLQPFAQNYSTVLNEDLTTFMTRVDSRRATVLNAINLGIPPVSFAITSNNTTVNSPFVTISGTGWVNVRDIRLAGSVVPLVVTWTGTNAWQVSVPLAPGVNNITLQALGFDGAVVGTTSQTITNSGTTQSAAAGNIVISKIMYHPALPNLAEQQAGYSAVGAEDEFEFIEVMNISAAAVDISGARFTAGIDYAFPARIVAPGERLVVARTPAAFAVRYPSVPAAVRFGPFTSGKLADTGEVLTLTNTGGQTIFSVTYQDGSPWPTGADGDGPSLVLIRPESNPSPALPQNWRHSAGLNGNPGVTDVVSYDTFKSQLSITDDNDDPDKDGLSNFLEYAQGTTPFAPSAVQVAISFNSPIEPVVHYTRRIGADDVTWDFQTSLDLANWVTAPSSFVYEGVRYNGDGTEDVRYRITAPAALDLRRFVRARATR
ncbi:MAG: hypothetical protein JWL90_1955, partial [Chthoniobacteraceae bacterium]|nr:hypothetical protein [Chthoniobacteraceae bacterium]